MAKEKTVPFLTDPAEIRKRMDRMRREAELSHQVSRILDASYSICRSYEGLEPEDLIKANAKRHESLGILATPDNLRALSESGVCDMDRYTGEAEFLAELALRKEPTQEGEQ